MIKFGAIRRGGPLIATGKGDTVLHCAAEKGWSDVVASVCTILGPEAAKAACGMRSDGTYTPLMNCVTPNSTGWNVYGGERTGELRVKSYNTYECARILLAHGAKVDAVDKEGHTALCWAVDYGRDDLVQLLLRHGAKVGPQVAAALREKGRLWAGGAGWALCEAALRLERKLLLALPKHIAEHVALRNKTLPPSKCRAPTQFVSQIARGLLQRRCTKETAKVGAHILECP